MYLVFNQPGVAVMKCHYIPSDNNAAAAPGPLFTKRMDVLPQDLGKSWSRKIRVWTFSVALKFDRHLGSSAVKFQSDATIRISSLATSTLHEILR